MPPRPVGNTWASGPHKRGAGQGLRRAAYPEGKRLEGERERPAWPRRPLIGYPVMEDENTLEGLVHHSLDESPDGLETLIEQHKSAVERFDLLGWPRPEVTVVSGSGLGVDLGERTHGPIQLDFLLPFPAHSVEGHQHAVEMFEPLPGRHALYYRGRLHSYQGYSANDTVFLQPHHRAGDLVLIRDQVNLTGLNPLRGQLPPEWGRAFRT